MASLSRRALWMQKIANEVVQGVTTRIQSGSLDLGAEVGTRDDLAREFVTSPGVVDRAVDILLGTGAVTEDDAGMLRVGSPVAPDQAFEIPEGAEARLADVLSILELRRGVEVESAALCAVRRSEGELAMIRSAAQAYETVGDGPPGAAQADFAFHRSIASACGNSYILELLDYLGPLLIPRMRIPLPERDGDGPEQHQKNSIAEHGVILAAIEAQDAEAARSAMRAHLDRTIRLMRPDNGS